MDPVQIDRFYLGCLAHASYLISSGGVAAVIDPQRDVDLYIEAAAAKGLRIAHVIETHLHADFVSGHVELAKRTGAKIYLGAGSGAHFEHVAVQDGDSISFGGAKLEFLQTPGHTGESICIVLTDANGGPKSIFTGDTLFVGDVGRPDLSPVYTPQELAAMLYQSLWAKVLQLPDDTVIYPAHGAGSLCGRQMSSEASSTLGRERTYNYALQAKSADEFVRLLTDNLPPRPEYFAKDAELNRKGAVAIADLPELASLSPSEVLRLQQEEGAVVVDTRPAMQFAVAHVPGAIHIALTGQYASWAARILGLDRKLIVCGEDPEHVRESQLRLARVGVENLAGYIDDGVTGWILNGYQLEYIPQISPKEAAELMENERDGVAVLDVREPGEIASAGRIAGSVSIPLGHIASRAAQELPKDKLIVVQCKGGYRSSIATSLLRRAGFENIANLSGGFDAWMASELPVTAT